MLPVIRQTLTVQADGRIEIRSPQLRPGDQAEVIVLLSGTREPGPAPAPAPPGRNLTSFIGAAKGTFQSAQDVDAYVRGLRDEWDR